MTESRRIRNFGIIAHIDAGKTTTTERILYLSGTNYKIGEVDDGTTTTDWMEEERERGITITSAAVSCNWKDSIFHIIDTPGHVDFTAEVQRCLRVLDGAVVVFCGVAGVQTQSETVWKQADRYNIPRIVFINKLDRAGANFDNVINELKNKLNTASAIITVPYYENDFLKGVIDIINLKLIIFKNDGNIENVGEIPQSSKEMALKYHEELINILTSFDDKLLELALQEKLTPQHIIDSLRMGTIKRNFVPVIAGSSLKNIGVPLLIDAINDYLPSPDDINLIDAYYVKKGEWNKIVFDPEGHPVAYIFKVQYNREKGLIGFIRIYSGKINNGDVLYNPRLKKRERIQDLLRVYADKFERLESAQAGDIVTLTGMKNIVTGDTLCNEAYQVTLEGLKFPEPVIYVKVEPKNTIDNDRLKNIIPYLMLEDPTITYSEDIQTGQTLVGGMGELHIQIFIERIRHHYGIELKSGSPNVACRETPRDKKTLTYNFDKKIEGNVQHASITLTIEPNERTKGNIIKSNLGKKYKDLLPSIEKGINDALRSGPEGAYPVIDTVITIESVEYDQSRSSELAIEASANLCSYSILRETGTIMLEPIMKVEIDLPSEYTGSVIGDLQSRGGIVIDIEKKVNEEIVFSKAPLKVMFGYTTTLRSLTQGKGSFSMEFLCYDSP